MTGVQTCALPISEEKFGRPRPQPRLGGRDSPPEQGFQADAYRLDGGGRALAGKVRQAQRRGPWVPGPEAAIPAGGGRTSERRLPHPAPQPPGRPRCSRLPAGSTITPAFTAARGTMARPDELDPGEGGPGRGWPGRGRVRVGVARPGGGWPRWGMVRGAEALPGELGGRGRPGEAESPGGRQAASSPLAGAPGLGPRLAVSRRPGGVGGGSGWQLT